LPLGLELGAFDAHRPTGQPGTGSPLILWNHRWEHDKNPEAFFRILAALAEEGRDFRLAVLGAPGSNPPPAFETARRQLADRIVAFGYADSFAAYARWLWAADLLPVTSRHDFFGISVMEALYCRTRPLLPRRMAYPELLPASWAEDCLYDDETELHQRLARLLDHGAQAEGLLSDLAATAGAYDWPRMAPVYDQLWAAMAPNG
jgi:glycosyltransferase involved in cell wall biosynthesis